MFGSVVLDVVIGMVFVYLLLSLLCSAIKEYIEAKFLNYRSQNLWKGIQLLLNGEITKGRGEGKSKPDMKIVLPTISSPPASQPAGSLPDEKLDLASLLYQHGLVRALYKGENQLPSYIPSRTFVLALWNLASEATGNKGVRDIDQIKDVIHRYIPNRELTQALYTLLDEADGDFNKAMKNIEDWYDAAMDRVSGWYKRHTQYALLLIGMITAILINADSVNIAKSLTQDKALREAIVASAADTLHNPPAALASPTPPTNTTPSGGDKTGANANNGNSNSAHASNSHATNSNANNANANSVNANNARAARNDNANANNANTNGAGTNNANANGAATPPAPDTPEGRIQQVRKELYDLGLPLGWVSKQWDDAGHLKNADDLRRVPQGWEWILKFFGLLLTGLAISQGAPFWFDVLNKFMVIRSTVKPKEKSPDEASKDKTTPNPKRDTHDGEGSGKT
jgi:hypothetical protein